MPEQKYALVLDSSNPNLNLHGIGQYLRDSVWIKGWANHLPYLLFLKSDLEMDDLNKRLWAVIQPARYVLLRMTDVTGWMPQPTWDWINETPPPFDPNWLLPQQGQTGTLTPLAHQSLIDSLLNSYDPAGARVSDAFESPGLKKRNQTLGELLGLTPPQPKQGGLLSGAGKKKP